MAGFNVGSIKNTCEAAIKLRPLPWRTMSSSSTRVSGELLKLSTAESLFPVRRLYEMPFACKAYPIMRNRSPHCENTSDLAVL